MCVLASLTSRVGAGFAGPVLALALAVPAYSADIIYERGYEYERYSEAPPVYAPPVHAAPIYVPPAYVPPVHVPRRYGAPPAYLPRRYAYRYYDQVYPPADAIPYHRYGRYVEIEPRPRAPIYGAPRPSWSARAPDLEIDEGVPYGWSLDPRRRW
jgi:hypothetical protein